MYWKRFGLRFWNGFMVLLSVRDMLIFSARCCTVPNILKLGCLEFMMMPISPAWDRCKRSPAYLMHTFWLCAGNVMFFIRDNRGHHRIKVSWCLTPLMLKRTCWLLSPYWLGGWFWLTGMLILINWNSAVSPFHTGWEIFSILPKLFKIRLSLSGSVKKLGNIMGTYLLICKEDKLPWVEHCMWSGGVL